MASGENLIAEAPTGSGKTAAALHPALAQGLASGRQVVFLTSKTLQQKMAVSSLVAMNERAFQTVQVRAKERMCANDRILCHEDFCRFAKDYPDKMERSNLLGRLRDGYAHLDPDTVFEEARREEVCPFEVQLEVASRADAIVADYNYVFEPAAALRHLTGDDLKEAILLIDEAHNLPDRARQIFSPEILEEDLAALRNRLALQAGDLFADIAISIEELMEILAEAAEELPEGEAIAEIEPPTERILDLRVDWEAKLMRYLAWKRETRLALVDDPVMDFHFTLQRFTAVLSMLGPDFTCVVERRANGIRLGLVCLDPARALAPVFRSAHSTILLSATLTPPEAIQRVLGLEKDRTSSISLPPPFPPENRKVMIVPTVRTTFKAREKNYDRIAHLLAGMSDAHGGNDLVLFPSYRFLTAVSEHMPQTRSRLLVQRPDLTAFERQHLLEALSSPPPGGTLLFAVSGGMYAEGVDYPGELLSAVFVVSPALPQVSFERELLRRYFDDKEEAGFDYAYLQPGMTRVVQAAGRLIRSETDRGVIALVCARFLEEPYASRLPRDWYDETPARARDEAPGRRDPRILREVPVKNPYTNPKMPRLTVDAWVRDRQGRVLLVSRGRPPFLGHWGLPGRLLRVEGDDRGLLRARDARGDGPARSRRRAARRVLAAGPGPARPQRHGALRGHAPARTGEGRRRRGRGPVVHAGRDPQAALRVRPPRDRDGAARAGSAAGPGPAP